MAGRRPLVALDLDQDRLVAVSASVSAREVSVRAWLSAQRPEGVAATDAAAVGAWIGAELKKAGLAKARAVFAVPRGDVVLKRMVLPWSERTTEADIAGMVKLQMSRQLTMQLEGTAIDYAPLGPLGERGPISPSPRATGAPTAAAHEGGVAVLAGAMPGDRLDWLKAVVKGAGLKIERVGLKAAGVAALLSEASQRRSGPILGVAPGASSTEFVIVDDGSLVFARAADIGRPVPPEEWPAFAERVAVEAKRTWMSYRVSRETADIEAIAVLGEGELARQIGQQCGRSLEMPYESVGLPRVVQLPADMPEAERSVAAPLIGLLAERFIARQTLDFAHPRRAPDLRARRRQRVLLGVLGTILALGGSYVAASMELEGMRGRVEAEKGRSADLRRDRDRLLRDHARLAHIGAWTKSRADLLGYATLLSETMPDPSRAILDGITARTSVVVEFTSRDGSSKGGGLATGTWEPKQLAMFSISGRMKDPAVARDLRGRLLDEGIFGVRNTGPDLPDRFSLELSTTRPAPPVPRGSDAAAGAALQEKRVSEPAKAEGAP